MYYYSVLGYNDNPLVNEYFEKYFYKLLKIAISRNYGSKFESFQGYDIEVQKNFILHPDISSLIQDDSSISREKFLTELTFFIQKSHAELTMNVGSEIPGTRIKLTMSDNNPQNTHIGHPDHDNEGMLGWGEKTPEEWLGIFSKSFQILSQIDSEFFDELNRIIKKIVPMKTSIDVHNSCSYKECVGTLYIGYTINAFRPEINILEAIIHESSHNKLNLIMQSQKLHMNDYSLQYYSPYRPDARHIQGVLLGIHAIVPTVHILLKVIEKNIIYETQWYEKVVLYHIKNKLGLRVVKKYMISTSLGFQVINEIEKVIGECDILIQKIGLLQKIDISHIQMHAKQHFINVKNDYPSVKY